MPPFDCRLVTADGEIVERVIDADSKFQVYELADERNEMILSVKEHKESKKIGAKIKNVRKVKPREIENFTSQLTIMLKAGVPLIGCLKAITEQTESETMHDVVEDVIVKVNGGQSLSQALAEYPRVFGTLYVNMVKAGEAAGVLDQILERLTTFIRHDIEVTRNIKSALRYPLIVFTALISAFLGAIVFVIPRFSKMFLAKGIDLPLPTRIMMGISTFMSEYWWLVIIGVIGMIAGFKYYIRTPAGAYQFDLFKLKVPVFNEIILKSSVSRFVHMMETLLKGGIQIIKALETTELTVGNLVVSRAISNAREKIAEGISLADALSESKYIPKMTVKMIAVGEQSGALEEMMTNIAYQYDEEVKDKIKRLSASIEPLITVVMGLFLVLIATGILLPIWQMYSTVQ